MAKSNEPFVWSLFSAGGVISALLSPVHILLLGIVVPLGWVALDVGQFVTLLEHPATRGYLFVLISLPFFHWAHRFRFTLIDLGLAKLDGLISLCCYGAAVIGTGYAAYIVWMI